MTIMQLSFVRHLTIILENLTVPRNGQILVLASRGTARHSRLPYSSLLDRVRRVR